MPPPMSGRTRQPKRSTNPKMAPVRSVFSSRTPKTSQRTMAAPKMTPKPSNRIPTNRPEAAISRLVPSDRYPGATLESTRSRLITLANYARTVPSSSVSNVALLTLSVPDAAQQVDRRLRGSLPGEAFSALLTARDELASKRHVRQHPAKRRADRRRINRLDEQRGVAGDLRYRRCVRGDDRHTAGHRLEHRQTEALV